MSEDKVNKKTQAELEAGRSRVEEHEKRASAIREQERARSDKEDPRLMKPYIAGEKIDDPTPGFVRLENETEEEAEARKLAVLAREEAIMKAREGGHPDPTFDPDAMEAERKRQADIKVAEDEAQRAREEADAKIKSQIKATSASDERAIDEGDRAKAEEGKKAEGEAKAGEPDESKAEDDKTTSKKGSKSKDKESTDVLDDLLKS